MSSRKYTGAISIGRAARSLRWVVGAKFGREHAENLGPVLGTLSLSGGAATAAAIVSALHTRSITVSTELRPAPLASGGVQAPTPSACCLLFLTLTPV